MLPLLIYGPLRNQFILIPFLEHSNLGSGLFRRRSFRRGLFRRRAFRRGSFRLRSFRRGSFRGRSFRRGSFRRGAIL
jgi:hypothetical protein